MMKNWMRAGLTASLMALFGVGAAQAGVPQTQFPITNLHHFAGGANDGANPYGSLTLSGTNLYGMTAYGGPGGSGVVFKVNLDGSGYTNLHGFASNGTPWENPLTLSGTNLYGMTPGSGPTYGTVFMLNTDGSGFTNLHTFTGLGGDGRDPFGALTLAGSGTTLYGMTELGGVSGVGSGVVFRLNGDGSGYTNLHTFTGSANDGATPNGSLTLYGTNLYGMANRGGVSNCGVIFKMNMDGSGFTNLHSFLGGSTDGAYPEGSLILAGTNLYGMANENGTSASAEGTIFKLNVNGSGYTNLHNFGSGATNGVYPWGDLLLSGSGLTLYGMAGQGGASGSGVVFKLSVDGSGYTNLHTFVGGANDGASPRGSLVRSGSILYGMAPFGGANDKGVIFAQPLNIWSAAVDEGGGLKHLDWFGDFYDGDGDWDNFIFHMQHGWLYCSGTTTSSIWFWSNDSWLQSLYASGWLWTNDKLYPYLVGIADSPAWFWYLKDSASPRWFYNFTQNRWDSH